MGKNVEKAQTKYHSGWKNTFRKNQDHPTHKTYATTTKAPAVKWHADSEKKTNYQGYDGSKYTFDRGHELPSLQKETNRSPSKASSEKDSEEEEFPRRVFVDNNPNYPDEPYGHFNKPRSTIKPIQTGKIFIIRLKIQYLSSNLQYGSCSIVILYQRVGKVFEARLKSIASTSRQLLCANQHSTFHSNFST